MVMKQNRYPTFYKKKKQCYRFSKRVKGKFAYHIHITWLFLMESCPIDTNHKETWFTSFKWVPVTRIVVGTEHLILLTFFSNTLSST